MMSKQHTCHAQSVLESWIIIVMLVSRLSLPTLLREYAHSIQCQMLRDATEVTILMG